MFKASALLFFHAETGLHAGSGESFGAVDLAIQRERHTGYPRVAASGVKGALRDWFRRRPADHRPDREADGAWLASAFGPETENASDHGGAVAFADARLLLFPVRSARGVFVWATSPAVLARLQRDAGEVARRRPLDPFPDVPALRTQAAVASADHVAIERRLLLEEYAFDVDPDLDAGPVARWLADNALPDEPTYEPWRARLRTHLVVLPDDAFAAFVQTSTEVQARVKLNEKKTTTGGGGNLFYQENLPSDSVLYSGLHASDDLSGHLDGGTADALLRYVGAVDGHRVQIGGDESVGKGVCCARVLPTPR